MVEEESKPKPKMLNFSQNNLPLIFTHVSFAPCRIWCELVIGRTVWAQGDEVPAVHELMFVTTKPVGGVECLGGHLVSGEGDPSHPNKLSKARGLISRVL